MSNRRHFLRQIAGAGIALPVLSGLYPITAFAQKVEHSPFMRLSSASSDRVMVIVRLFGGNDGLNTLVPYHNDLYYTARKRGSSADVSIPAEEVLPLHDRNTLGFHPGCAPLSELYTEGKIAIVQNVGYPQQNLSHFRSTDIWLSASDADVFEASGWYARYLEDKFPDYPDVLPPDPYAIELGTNLGTALVGKRSMTGIALHEVSLIPDQLDPLHSRGKLVDGQIEYIREVSRQSNVFLHSLSAAQEREPGNVYGYPDNSSLAEGLARIARLIASGLQTQLYIVNLDGFDTHHNQRVLHGHMISVVADAIYAFQRDIEALGVADRVCLMTISEFGRRVESLGLGTDHGAAAPLFVVGNGVKPGIIGHDPDLDDLDPDGNLKMEFDFRQVYASVLGQWLGASDDDIYGTALPRYFEQLPIFKQGTTRATEPDGQASVSGIRLRECYPNPASSHVTVAIERRDRETTGYLVLFGSDGKRVLKRELGQNEQELRLNLRSVVPGSYTLAVIADGAIGDSRLIQIVR